MKRKNRILGFLLAFVLLFANIQPIPAVRAEDGQKVKSGMTVTLRVEGIDKTVVSQRKITLPDTYKSLSEYGLEGISDSGMYTPMHALAQYCENEEISTDVIKADKYGNINSFNGLGGNGESYLMFVINNQYQADENGMGYLFGNYPLKDGDSIVLYDYIWSATSAYTYFEDENISATTEKPFSVKVNAHDGMGGFFEVNSVGASLVLEDMDGKKVSDDLYTATKVDEDESATMTIHQAGDYRLTVDRTNKYGQPDVSRAYALVHVKVSEELSDETAVELAAQELLADAEPFQEIKEDLALPTDGIKGTTITWQSSEEEFLGNDGKLKKRLVGEDKKITLKALVSKGKVKKEVKISGTIKGYYLKSLSVTPGTLSFDPKVKDYTVYVSENTEKVLVSLNAGTEATMAKIDGSVISGSNEVKGEKDIVLKGKETVIEIEASFPKAGNMQKAATITVKKSVSEETFPKLPAAWPQHYGSDDNNAVVNKSTVTENAKLVWETPGEQVNEWANYAGHPIIVNDDLYVARGQKLQIIDSQTGKIKKTAKLAKKTGYYSYITYGDGKIFVPLTNGQVQCFHASTLESLFITEIPGAGWQALGSVYYQNGMMYTGFASSSGNEGAFFAYRTKDINSEETLEKIKPEWSVDTGKGYYGSGSVAVNEGKHLVFAGDAGIVTVVDAVTGKEISRITLAGAARTAVVSAEGYLWTATKSTKWGETSGNKLYKLAVNGKGKISKVKETTLPDITGSTPIVADGKVVVGGGSWGKGFLQVYDLELNLLAESQTESEVKSPTATTAYNDLYVYFAQNTTPGGLYVAKISKNNKMTISMLHKPEADKQNYSMSNVVVGEDGTLYYANDSGYLFALKKGKAPVKPEPEPTPNPEPKPEEKPEQKPEAKPEQKPEQKPEAKPEQKPEQKPETKPEIKPVSKSEGKSEVQHEQKSEKKTDVKDKKENAIVKAIKKNAALEKENVTISDVPEIVEAEVFAELAKHPEMQLILDCGTYTISIQGSDVVNTGAFLSTKIEKVKSTVSKEIAEKLGSFEQYRLAQKKELPGKITVVLKLSELLKNEKVLYLYDVEAMDHADKVITDSEYAMFTLENSNDFILATEDLGESKEVGFTETEEKAIKKQKDSKNWGMYILSGIVSILVLLLVGRIIYVRKHRKVRNAKREK